MRRTFHEYSNNNRKDDDDDDERQSLSSGMCIVAQHKQKQQQQQRKLKNEWMKRVFRVRLERVEKRVDESSFYFGVRLCYYIQHLDMTVGSRHEWT